MAKILCVLYDDPIGGMPASYPRDDLPRIDRYPDGQTLPTPKGIDFQHEPLPKSGPGKVLKRELRLPYWEGSDRQIH